MMASAVEITFTTGPQPQSKVHSGSNDTICDKRTQWELQRLSFRLISNTVAVIRWVIVRKTLEIFGIRFQASVVRVQEEAPFSGTGATEWENTERVRCSSRQRDKEINIKARLRKTQLQLGKEDGFMFLEQNLESRVKISQPVEKRGVFRCLTLCAGI
jgi:hypothetical protein